MSNFSQDQGSQGVARRRTYGTSHKQARGLTLRLRKRAIYGWKQARLPVSGIVRIRKMTERIIIVNGGGLFGDIKEKRSYRVNRNPLKLLVGTKRFELLTPTVSG
jgi:hypothetical protein